MDASDAHASNEAPSDWIPPTEKRGSLFDGALTDEVLDSSPTVLKRGRGAGSTIGAAQR